MSKLDHHLEVQRKVLTYLAEHTTTDFDSRLTETEIAAALALTVEDTDAALQALAKQQLVDTTGSHLDETVAFITPQGQQQVKNPQGNRGETVYNNQFNGPVHHLQVGNNNTMHVNTGMQAPDLLGLLEALKGSLEALPEEKKAQALEQVADLQEDAQAGKTKPSRLLAVLTFIQSLSGGTKEVIDNIKGIAKAVGLDLPGA